MRVETHFTGRASFHASHAMRISSRYGPPFTPKPPPTSGAITRTRASSSPTIRATSERIRNGFCVEIHTVSSPVTGIPARERAARLERHAGQARLLTHTHASRASVPLRRRRRSSSAGRGSGCAAHPRGSAARRRPPRRRARRRPRSGSHVELHERGGVGSGVRRLRDDGDDRRALRARHVGDEQRRARHHHVGEEARYGCSAELRRRRRRSPPRRRPARGGRRRGRALDEPRVRVRAAHEDHVAQTARPGSGRPRSGPRP